MQPYVVVECEYLTASLNELQTLNTSLEKTADFLYVTKFRQSKAADMSKQTNEYISG
jgi:hypothetical protein